MHLDRYPSECILSPTSDYSSFPPSSSSSFSFLSTTQSTAHARPAACLVMLMRLTVHAPIPTQHGLVSLQVEPSTTLPRFPGNGGNEIWSDLLPRKANPAALTGSPVSLNRGTGHMDSMWTSTHSLSRKRPLVCAAGSPFTHMATIVGGPGASVQLPACIVHFPPCPTNRTGIRRADLPLSRGLTGSIPAFLALSRSVSGPPFWSVKSSSIRHFHHEHNFFPACLVRK